MMCAPTGAGKTNVALLTIMREISKRIDPVKFKLKPECNYFLYKLLNFFIEINIFRYNFQMYLHFSYESFSCRNR